MSESFNIIQASHLSFAIAFFLNGTRSMNLQVQGDFQYSYNLGNDFDCPIQVLVLGTGSKYAARVYTKEGFTHLLGGLSEATRGYNPDDEGEWMMVRTVRQGSLVPSLPGDFYNKSCTAADIEVEPLQRHHLASLVLLLCSTESCSKLILAGIDTGIEAEGALLKLLASNNRIKCFVAINTKSRHPHGIKVLLDDGKEDLFAISDAAEHKLNSCCKLPILL